MVRAIRGIVGEHVYLMEAHTLPFPDHSFDCIVVVDILEHVHDDRAFIYELHRTLRPGGRLIVNTPHLKSSLLYRARGWLGLGEEGLGAARIGYTRSGIKTLLKDRFKLEVDRTYRHFFSQLFDTLALVAMRYLHSPPKSMAKHAPMVTKQVLEQDAGAYSVYRRLYPVIRAFCALDRLVPFSGYHLIARGHRKP